MGTIIGIDLGTTYSAVAYINSLGKPEILPNREGDRITPSVVFFQGDSPLVGKEAKNSAAIAPYDVVQFVKREMGNPSWVYPSSSGASYRAEEISAIILRRLKDDAELMLGEGSVTDAVITVPAYFDDARRRATMDAGKIAGLNVRRVLNEPTAAALAYGLDNSQGGVLVVYDLGGGTFDVTVMRVGSGEFDVLATGGDRNLGGFNWDGQVMEWLNEQFMAEGGPDLMEDAAHEAGLRERAESAKRSLTSVATTKVILGADGVTKTITLTREIFDDLTSGMLGRTRDMTLDVLEEAGMTWTSVSNLLLVGGSTRMPQVRNMMAALSGKEAERTIHPDEVVAMGAAVQAHLLEAESGVPGLPELLSGGQPIVIKDVTSQSLGTLTLDRDSRQMVNSIIIPHNSKIPTKMSNFYETVRDNQDAVRIDVTEGDDTDPDYVTVIGGKDIKMPPYPSGAPIEVFYAYDVDQTIFVEVYDRTVNGLLGSFEIDRIANFNDQEVADRTAKIRNLEIN